MKHLIAFLKEEEGLTVVEYAIAAGLISATVISGFKLLGGKVSGIINWLEGQLTVPS